MISIVVGTRPVFVMKFSTCTGLSQLWLPTSKFSQISATNVPKFFAVSIFPSLLLVYKHLKRETILYPRTTSIIAGIK